MRSVVSLVFLVIFSFLPFARYGLSELIDLHPLVLRLVLWQQLVLPALTMLIGQIVGIDPHILFLVLVVLISGSLFASPTLVRLMGLDDKMAIQTVFVSTLATPIAVFIPFGLFNQGDFTIDFSEFAERLVMFFGIPFIVLALGQGR